MVISEEKQSLWKTERLRELAAMLNFKNKPKDPKTKYMEFSGRNNGFSERKVLPKPTKVK